MLTTEGLFVASYNIAGRKVRYQHLKLLFENFFGEGEVNHGFQANTPAIRITSTLDGTEIISYTCSHLPDASSVVGVKFDWVSSVSGIKGSYSDSSWA